MAGDRSTRSPIPALTGLDVDQLRCSRPARIPPQRRSYSPADLAMRGRRGKEALCRWEKEITWVYDVRRGGVSRMVFVCRRGGGNSKIYPLRNVTEIRIQLFELRKLKNVPDGSLVEVI